jgi:co-chaperonin GroES (HSP10)
MIQPLHDKIAIVRLKASSTTASGIIVEKGLGEVDKAKIIATGPKVLDVKVGDTVLVDWNKAVPTKMDDIPVYILKEENIVGIYEE